jgi:hypothetical protein
MNPSLAAKILYSVMFASLSVLATETVPPEVNALPGSVSDEAPNAVAEQVNPSKIEPMMIEPTAEQHAAAYRRDLAACEYQNAGNQACRDAVDARYRDVGKCEALDGAARTECLDGGTSGGQ